MENYSKDYIEAGQPLRELVFRLDPDGDQSINVSTATSITFHFYNKTTKLSFDIAGAQYSTNTSQVVCAVPGGRFVAGEYKVRAYIQFPGDSDPYPSDPVYLTVRPK